MGRAAAQLRKLIAATARAGIVAFILMMIETELFAFASDSRWCRLCRGSDADGCDGECVFDPSSVAKGWQLYLYTVEAQPFLAQDEAAQQTNHKPFTRLLCSD